MITSSIMIPVKPEGSVLSKNQVLNIIYFLTVGLKRVREYQRRSRVRGLHTGS